MKIYIFFGTDPVPIESLSYLNTLEAHIWPGAPYYDLLTSKAHLRTRGVLFKMITLLLRQTFFSTQGLFVLDLLNFQKTRNNKIELYQSPKAGKMVKIQEILRKSKLEVLGNDIRKVYTKFLKSSSIRNAQKLWNSQKKYTVTWILLSTKTGKTAKNQEII